jgi:C-terminal processing protease CtpA/Prc
MHRHFWLILVAIVILAVVPAFAGHGGDHAKCKYSTQDCLDHMANKMKNSGWVGVELETENAEGYEVKQVVPGSPAEAAGIQAGDILVALNGVRISDDNEEALTKARKEWKPGQTVTYTIKRNGSERQVTLTLGTWPADALAKMIGEHMLEHANGENVAKK